MKSQLVNEIGGQRTFVVVLDPGEEAFAALTAFAVEQKIGSASLTAIGAFEKPRWAGLIRPRRPTAKSLSTNSARF